MGDWRISKLCSQSYLSPNQNVHKKSGRNGTIVYRENGRVCFYKQLTSSEISVGRKFVQDVLTNAAKQTATNYVSKYMTKGIDAVIKKATSK